MIYDFIIYAIIIIILVLFIIIFNKISRSSIKVDEAFSGIDVALAKRYDLLTQMIEIVKGYMKHEKDVLFEVVKLRKGMTISEKETANDKMDASFNKVNLLIEKYPELKADKNVMVLQKSVIDVEEHLQAARRLYNSNVSIYNQMIKVFPSNIIAKITKKKEREFFKAEESKVKVEL